MSEYPAGTPMARFLWLPPIARPRIAIPRRQEIVLLLVGTTLLFSSYDLDIFGLALPQIQASLHIPEDMAGLTVTYFRLAALVAMLIAPLADIFGRRRLLLFTVFMEAVLTVATAFTQDYAQFVWVQIAARIFGYCEELLCFVVIAEEIDARVRGWATGILGAIGATGAGVAAIVFALVNVLPFGWRAIYVIGGSALFILAYFRRLLPETGRFEVRKKQITALGSKSSAALDTLVRLIREHPGRLAAMMTTVGLYFFAVAPSTVLMSKYLQQTHHYKPHEVSLLYLFGGFISVVGTMFAGRISDRVGRKRVVFASTAICGASFAYFLSGVDGWTLPASWILAIFGYISCDTLFAGYAVEIFPTAYRATASTMRYVVAALCGALALWLEGVVYDHVGAHGPAMMVFLAAIPLTLIAILFLPETSQKTLEEISAEDVVPIELQQGT